MKSTIKSIASAAAALMLAAGMTGCGNSKTASEPENSSNVEVTAAVTEADTNETTQNIIAEAPQLTADAATDADFIGKWEGDYTYDNGINAASYYGTPVSALFRIEIYDDGTGIITRDPQLNENGENSAQSFKWTVEENILTADFGVSQSYYYISGGQLIVPPESQDDILYVYLNKVTEYTPYDPGTISEDSNAAAE